MEARCVVFGTSRADLVGNPIAPTGGGGHDRRTSAQAAMDRHPARVGHPRDGKAVRQRRCDPPRPRLCAPSGRPRPLAQSHTQRRFPLAVRSGTVVPPSRGRRVTGQPPDATPPPPATGRAGACPSPAARGRMAGARLPLRGRACASGAIIAGWPARYRPRPVRKGRKPPEMQAERPDPRLPSPLRGGDGGGGCGLCSIPDLPRGEGMGWRRAVLSSGPAAPTSWETPSHPPGAAVMIAGPPHKLRWIATRPASVTRAMARLSASGGVTRPARAFAHLPVGPAPWHKATRSDAFPLLFDQGRSSPHPGAVA